MIRWYSLLLYLLLPLLFVRLIWRGFRNPAYWYRWHERFGFIPNSETSQIIWIHAVSVGEVRAAAPLVNNLLERHPGGSIMITTTTPTGSEQVGLLFGDKVAHSYVPYDLPSAVNRFLDRVRPKIAVIMETELWPNIFHTCHQRNIPIIIANVRLSESSLRGYKKIARLVKSTLQQVSKMAVQSQADAERLLALGAPEWIIRVTGSMKFDMTLPASVLESGEALRREWGAARPVWVAASTHEGEDERLLTAFREIKTRFANLLLVLVPRHPERFAPVARLCRKAGFRVALRSKVRGPLEETVDILVGDTMGELLMFFAASDLAFIGGSLVPTGGHNLLEAAAVGKPMIFGPHMFNFKEISALALERGAGIQVQNESQLASAVTNYLSEPNLRYEAGQAGKNMVEDNRGALEQTLVLINELLPA